MIALKWLFRMATDERLDLNTRYAAAREMQRQRNITAKLTGYHDENIAILYRTFLRRIERSKKKIKAVNTR